MEEKHIYIDVNNKRVKAVEGETLLEALKRQAIHIPTLCNMKNMFPSGACRMCVVENENTGKLITSCSYPVEEGMKIKTHSTRVLESRKTIVELLLSNHPDDCLYCVRNSNCELQSLSKDLNITERRISGKKNKFPIDISSPSIRRDPDKCILCGRCVRTCEEVMGVSSIDFIGRGSKTSIGTAFNKGLNTSSCINCGQCIMVCPTGALSEKSHLAEVQDALHNPDKKVVVQYAPAISVSIAEEFGLPAGVDMNGVLNAVLRSMGFDRVFDTSFSADLTIMEEANELISRLKSGKPTPMFTSCCPAWVKYLESFSPDLIPNLSSCKSPQQMLGSLIKSYLVEKENTPVEDIYSVSIMPCTAKKFEAQRVEMTTKGITDVDAVLTTRELVELIKFHHIDLNKITPELTDSPLGMRSTAGKLFAASGGVMEAALRTAHYELTGEEMIEFEINQLRGMEGRKEFTFKLNDLDLGVAVVSGIANARVLLDEIKNGRNDLHFIEVMACPGGCIAGGGQRIGADPEDVKARMRSIYKIDGQEALKVSHKNPEIKDIYDDYLGEPLGEKSHKLLHTHYKDRDVMI